MQVTVCADIVVAADGAGSKARSLLQEQVWPHFLLFGLQWISLAQLLPYELAHVLCRGENSILLLLPLFYCSNNLLINWNLACRVTLRRPAGSHTESG